MDDPNDPENWTPLRHRLEAFLQIKVLREGPKIQLPESLIRETLAEQYGCRPEDVTHEQIKFEVSGLLSAYQSIEVVPSEIYAHATAGRLSRDTEAIPTLLPRGTIMGARIDDWIAWDGKKYVTRRSRESIVEDDRLALIGSVKEFSRHKSEASVVIADIPRQLKKLRIRESSDAQFDSISAITQVAITGSRYEPNRIRQEARKLKTQAVYKTWQKAYRTLKKQNPNKSDSWCAQQISWMDIAKGKSVQTIRRRLKNQK